MIRQKALFVLTTVLLMGTLVQAQDPPSAPAADGFLFFLGQQVGQPANATVGGRGARNTGLFDVLSVLERAQANPVNTTVNTSRGLLVSPNSGAWWTNTTLLTRLGLTDDQKLRIERIFESNRQNLTTARDTLEKEETQLAKLLDAEPLDRSSVTTQIFKVVQARGEMEKVNALMTLEMREVLTRAQWTQLQVQQSVNVTVGAPNAGQRGGRSGGLGTQDGGVGGFGGGRSGGPAAPGTAPGRGGARGQ